MDALANIVWISLIAALIALFVRSRGWGIAFPLLACGLVVGVLPWGPSAPDDPELLQVLVLAPLVFGEALSSSYVDLKSVRRPVLALAVGLVAISTLAIGGLTSVLIAGIPVAMALALGAILAPTDAVVVAASARRANLPPRLVSILEGESLLNDGTGLTALRVATLAALAGSVGTGQAAALLVQTVAVGVAFGLLGGWLLVLLLRRSDDTAAHGAVLLMAPIPLYLSAETAGGSGILAVVLAALMASQATYADPAYEGRLQVTAVWRAITVLLQAAAFFLLGLELPEALRHLPAEDRTTLWWAVPAIVAGLIAVRMVVVWGAFGLGRLFGTDIPNRWRSATLVGWAGSRGPVSALAAFSLPLATADGLPLPARDMVVAATLLAVAVTLVLSTTLTPMARLLKIQSPDTSAVESRLRLAMARAALSTLDAATADADLRDDPFPAAAIAALRTATVHRVGVSKAGSFTRQDHERLRELQVEMFEAEQLELHRLRSEEALPDSAVRPLLTEVDRRIAAVRTTGAA